MLLHSDARRSGATLVEVAIIFNLVLVLLIGLVVGAMGVFRYQQMAYLAREAARYAAVHGGQYQHENAQAISQHTLPNVTRDYIQDKVILANASNLDASLLQVTITLNNPNGSFDWDDTDNNNQRWPNTPQTINGTNYNVTNTVSVTVTYQWTPEWFFSGPITMSSTAVMPMCY
jgi:hypothetical protein